MLRGLKQDDFWENVSKRRCNTLTSVQCFVLCHREEGLRTLTVPYFGQPAFRHRNFVIWGGGVGGRDPPPTISIPG